MPTCSHGNYPRPLLRGLRSRADGGEDCLEGLGAFEAHGTDCGSDIGLEAGDPLGSVSVCDLALDDGGPQFAFRLVVGRVDFAGETAEGEKLLPGSGEL